MVDVVVSCYSYLFIYMHGLCMNVRIFVENKSDSRATLPQLSSVKQQRTIMVEAEAVAVAVEAQALLRLRLSDVDALHRMLNVCWKPWRTTPNWQVNVECWMLGRIESVQKQCCCYITTKLNSINVILQLSLHISTLSD